VGGGAGGGVGGNRVGGARGGAAGEQAVVCKPKYDAELPSRARRLSRLAAIAACDDPRLKNLVQKYDAADSRKLAVQALKNANELHKKGFKIVLDAWPESVCEHVFEHARDIIHNKGANLTKHLRPFPINNSTSQVTFTPPQSSLTPL